MSINILMIVIKNTAALDFAVPLLWKIKQENPQAKISVLYCVLSKNRILRRSKFYSTLRNKYGIIEYDLADFLPHPYVKLKGLWGWLYSTSYWDSSPWEFKLNWLPFGKSLAKYIQGFTKEFEQFLTNKINYQTILPSLSPDIVLLNHTASTTSMAVRARDFIYDYLGQTKKKTILLPHAPHFTGTTAFHPFDKNGEKLPDYCEYWMPFKFDKIWEKLPEKKSQFFYAGYPGFDPEWLEQIKLHKCVHSGGNSLKCLFIIRRFLSKGETRPPNLTPFIQDYDDFLYYLNLVVNALKSAGVDIELIVKPHPSNDFQALKELFAESKIPNCRITNDSIYALIPEVDFVISIYSTSLLIPAMAGIPVVLLNSSVQSAIHQWEEMKQLYTGLHFYLEDPADLPLRLKEVIEIAYERRKTGLEWNGDVEHLRHFYPDGAIQRCINRLGVHIG